METTQPQSNRDSVRERLLKHFPQNGIGAEIGVWKGHFSEQILKVAKPTELHLVDPWLYQPEFPNTQFGSSSHKDAMEMYYLAIKERYAHDDHVKIHRMTSEAFFRSMPEGYFDWIYLDGNHNMPFILEDIRAALRVLKPTSRLGGDDYHWKSSAKTEEKPVKFAVDTVVAELGDQVSFKAIGSQWLLKLQRD